MAYIGRQLVRGQNRVLDDISGSFNGSTTAFNLTVSSSSSPPASVNQLWIILGGVLQKPGTDFTVADAVITFTTAPASTLSFWGMIQGDTSDINSPADASVTPSKIANSGDFAFPADVRFKDADASHYVGLQAPSTVSSNLVWTLPAADGSANQVLKTDGSGALGWASDANAPEGTAVLSTGETGTTKYLRVDGDNTCSWQLAVDATKMPLAGGTFTGDITIPDKIIHDGDTNTAIRFPAADTVSVETGGSERLRVDSSGRLLVGNTASNTMWGYGHGSLQLTGDYDEASASFINDENNTNSHAITLAKIRGSSIVQSGDVCGAIAWNGYDGSAYKATARIHSAVDGTPGAGDMPGRLVFETVSDGGSTPSERMRIDNSGKVGINTNSPAHKLHVEDSVSNVIVAKQTTNNGGHNTFAGVDSFGNVKFYASHNGRVGAADGIIFGSDTAAANLLNDYEEGTWTPAIASGGWTLSSTNKANYTKIGDRVIVTLYIGLGGSGDGSNLTISGLPYTSEGNGYNTGAVDFGLGGKKGAYVRTYSSDTSVNFYYSSESTSTNRYQIIGTDLGAGYIITTFSYKVA